MTRTRAAICAAVVALALAGAACGGDDGSEVGSSATTAGGGATTDGGGTDGGGAADQTVTIKDFTYDPSELTIEGSTTIEVVNEDDTEHSFTLDDDSASQDVEGGESATVTIDPAASIGWHCEYHPDTMKGSITVG
jgi:plastocyanin